MTGRELQPRPPLRLVGEQIVAPRAPTIHDVRLDQAYEKLAAAERQRRRTSYVNWALIVVVGCQAAAIAVLAPPKEPVPQAILVDRQTGQAQAVGGAQASRASAEAAARAFLAQYVTQRETVDPADAKARLARVAAWSTGAARTTVAAPITTGDAQARETVRVQIRAIEFVDPQGARVRFTATRAAPGLPAQSGDWQALIAFRVAGGPLRNEDRAINPLGLQVTDYRRAPDVAAPAAAPAAPAPSVDFDAVAARPDDPADATTRPAFVLSIEPESVTPNQVARPAPQAKPSSTSAADVTGPTE